MIVTEALFKNIFIVLLFSNLYASSNDYFVLNNYTPYNESKNSIGFHLVQDNNNSKYFFNYQSWFTNNFYFDGYISQLNDGTNIIYGSNIGYKISYDFENFKETIYSLGYFSKRFSSENVKISSLSIIQSFRFNKISSFLYFNYLFNNDTQYRSLKLKFLKSLKRDVFINFGLDYNDFTKKINHIIGVIYKL